MKSNFQNGKLANFRRKNLMSFSFLTKRQSSQYLEIDASENFIICIDELVKYSFSNLCTLNLSANLIVCIEPLVLCEMPKLKMLHLYGNQIVSIQPLKECKFPDLQTLKLGFSNRGNYIKEIQSLTQCNFPKLIELTMDCNQITCSRPLRSYAFKEITLLYLASNKIETIPQDALYNFPNLKMLSFKDNYIRSLIFLTKPNFHALQFVNMQDNELLDIKEIHRYSLKNVEKIVLCGNRIYSNQELMKCDWPNAASFNFFQKQDFQFPAILFKKIYQKFLGKKEYVPSNI